MAEPPNAPASHSPHGATRTRRAAGLPPLSPDRIASLSDTVFGVAMTLLATALVPEAETLTGSAVAMLHALAEPLSAVALSFAVAAIFWFSQQRRLSMMEHILPRQTALHLAFLFLVMMLPISTGIFARREAAAAPVAIYGVHATLLAAINLALWIDVHRRVAVWRAIIPSALAVIMLGSGFGIGLFYPWLAQYVWYAALGVPLLTHPLHLAFLRLQNGAAQE